MRTRGLKALFALLALDKTSNKQADRDRVILIFSNAVTLGLIAIHVFGKATSRWRYWVIVRRACLDIEGAGSLPPEARQGEEWQRRRG
jgi:hypothetical protein